MFMVYLLFAALFLCVITAVSLTVSFVFLLLKKPKYKRLFGLIALISAGISYLIYFYSRIIISGGTFSDRRVVLVTLVYIIFFAIGALLFVNGKRNLPAE